MAKQLEQELKPTNKHFSVSEMYDFNKSKGLTEEEKVERMLKMDVHWFKSSNLGSTCIQTGPQ